jgi:hypothetical protein
MGCMAHMNYTVFVYFLFLTTLSSLAIDTINTDTNYYNSGPYQQINLVPPRRNNSGMYAASRYHRSHWHSSTHTIDLWTCSALQLAQYFFYHGYSEKKILSHNTLYMSDEFVKLAKTYPSYEAAITDLHKKLIKWTRLGNFFRKVWGSYCTGLTERIHYLYQEIQHRKQVVNAQANSQSNTTATCSLVKRWQQNAAACQDHNTKKRLEKRIKAAPKNGPAIAYVLYQEYVDILETASHIPKQGNEILRDTIGQASSIGLEANKAGYLETASQLADFCWTILDYTKAVGEGICLGATNTVHTLTHPVQTVKNALIGIATIAYGLTKVVGAVGKCGLLYVIDSDRYYIRRDIIIDQLKTITKDASNYLASTSARDVIKHGTAFVTEGLLLAKTVTLARDLSCRMLPVAMKYFEYITIEEPFACLVDGELIAIEIPKGMNLHSLEGNILKMESKQFPTQVSNRLIPTTCDLEEIINAIAKIDSNRINHILTPKTTHHAWEKIISGEIRWEKVKSIIEKVMLEGESVKVKGDIVTQQLHMNGEKIIVMYRHIQNKLTSIVNAWVETI